MLRDRTLTQTPTDRKRDGPLSEDTAVFREEASELASRLSESEAASADWSAEGPGESATVRRETRRCWRCCDLGSSGQNVGTGSGMSEERLNQIEKEVNMNRQIIMGVVSDIEGEGRVKQGSSDPLGGGGGGNNG